MSYEPTFTLTNGKLSELDSYILTTKRMRRDIEQLISIFENGDRFWLPNNMRVLVIKVLRFLYSVNQNDFRIIYLIILYDVESGCSSRTITDLSVLAWSYTHGYMRLAHTILYGPSEYMSVSPKPTRFIEKPVKTFLQQCLRRIGFMTTPKIHVIEEATTIPTPPVVSVVLATELSEKLKGIKTLVEHPFYYFIESIADIPEISSSDINLLEKTIKLGVPKEHYLTLVTRFQKIPVIYDMITVFEHEFTSQQNMELE